MYAGGNAEVQWVYQDVRTSSALLLDAEEPLSHPTKEEKRKQRKVQKAILTYLKVDVHFNSRPIFCIRPLSSLRLAQKKAKRCPTLKPRWPAITRRLVGVALLSYLYVPLNATPAASTPDS